MILTLSSGGMERTGGKFTKKISHPEIWRVEILEFPTGKIAEIRVRLENRGTIALQGFDCMETIAAKLENFLPDRSLIHRKSLAANWNHPFVLVVILAFVFVGLLLAESWSSSAREIILMLVSLGYGFYSLSSRPLSQRMGMRFEKFEVILGLGLILSGLATLVMLLIEVGRL